MRIATTVDYARGGVVASVDEVVELERVGLDMVVVPEAYSFDAVSQLGFLAARTHRILLASGVLQLLTRTPTLTAMTAASLDSMSAGRFVLGIGVSGPQVVEGFHGVPFDHPLGRTREVIEICRQVWRREKVEHDGVSYQVPLSRERGGSGLGKPLRIANPLARERIPIMLAASGPKNVALAAELAEAWIPPFLHPEHVDLAFGAALAEGNLRRDPSLGPLELIASPALAIGPDVAARLDRVRPSLARAIGGMGARGKNFYNDLARAYGYDEAAERIQDLYLSGDRDAAEAAVPGDLLAALSLVGTSAEVRDRVAAFAEAGVTTLNVRPLADTPEERRAFVAELRTMLD